MPLWLIEMCEGLQEWIIAESRLNSGRAWPNTFAELNW